MCMLGSDYDPYGLPQNARHEITRAWGDRGEAVVQAAIRAVGVTTRRATTKHLAALHALLTDPAITLAKVAVLMPPGNLSPLEEAEPWRSEPLMNAALAMELVMATQKQGLLLSGVAESRLPLLTHAVRLDRLNTVFDRLTHKRFTPWRHTVTGRGIWGWTEHVAAEILNSAELVIVCLPIELTTLATAILARQVASPDATPPMFFFLSGGDWNEPTRLGLTRQSEAFAPTCEMFGQTFGGNATWAWAKAQMNETGYRWPHKPVEDVPMPFSPTELVAFLERGYALRGKSPPFDSH